VGTYYKQDLNKIKFKVVLEINRKDPETKEENAIKP
jgi:hypothetical protein